MVKVSIVIPVWNRLDFTRMCLDALYRTLLVEDVPFEVIVIDNGSSDGTQEFFKSCSYRALHVLRNPENLGFARACNQGASVSKGQYLLFLNNDTEPRANWLTPLIRVLDRDARVAAVGSKLLFPDGTVQHAGIVMVDHQPLRDPLLAYHIYRRWGASHPAVNECRTYQAVTAACVLVRRSAFEAVGGFDEGYWNGYEDVDLCFKLREKGWLIVYEPKSVLIHYESQSGPERFRRVRDNVERLHRKWLGKVLPDFIVDAEGRTLVAPGNQIRLYVSPGEQPLTSLIMLTRNNLAYTKLCLESIRKHTREPYEVIVVDNGSTDGTTEYLRSQPDVRLIENGYNLGFALGNNRGLREARGTYIVFLNNDVVVTEGWLTRLLACAQSEPTVGIVGPRSNYVAGVQLVPNIPYGNDLRAMELFAQAWSLEHAGQWEQVPRVVGFCMLVRREVVERIGGFDSRFGLGNFEDDDFCLRAQIAGFTVRIAHDVFVHHFGSKTFQSERIDYRRLMEENWEIFKKKWNLPPDAPMEKGYIPASLVAQTFDRSRDFIPLTFPPLPLDNPKEEKYLAVFTPEVLRWFLLRFTARDPVTLVLYHPSESAFESVQRVIKSMGFGDEEIPDILLYPGELPAPRVPELVAAVDTVLYNDRNVLFLPWAVYLGKKVVKVPENA